MTVALTATGLLGTVLMEFAATVRALDLDSADYGLPQPEEVTVASGYTGYLHTDISLGASAADGVLSALSGAFPSGVSLSLLSDSRGVAAHLTQGLDGVSFRPEVTLTVSRGANYNPLEQIATLLVTALPTPPTASASGRRSGFPRRLRGMLSIWRTRGMKRAPIPGGALRRRRRRTCRLRRTGKFRPEEAGRWRLSADGDGAGSSGQPGVGGRVHRRRDDHRVAAG